jgi:hypothetical protein
MNWSNRRAELRDACQTVRRFVTAWDPAGLGGAAPDDEYDRLVHFVVSRLNSGADAATLGDLLRHEVGRHFGVPAAAPHVDEVAAQLVAWWATLAPAEQQHRLSASPLVFPSRDTGDRSHEVDVAPEAVGEFAYLWDGSDPDWVVSLDPDGRIDQGLPVNRRTGHALVICENDDLAAAVVRAMRAHGVPVVSAESLRERTGRDLT